MSLDSPPPSLDSSSQNNKNTPGSDNFEEIEDFEGKYSAINVDDDGDCDMTIENGSEDIAAASPIDKLHWFQQHEMDVMCEELGTSEVMVRLPVSLDDMFEDRQVVQRMEEEQRHQKI